MSSILLGTDSANHPVRLDLDLLLGALVQASSGGGKSWLLRRLMEQAYPHMQILCIDPEGEFASLRERFGFVLAGRGGDTATDIRSAELLAHRLLELQASAICDIFEMRPADRHRWVRLFLDALIESPKKLWHPVLVIVDEAHVFAPEKGQGESEAHQAMLDLATRGRKRGLRPVFATQRIAQVAKTVLGSSVASNVLVGPTVFDDDADRAGKGLGIPSGKEMRELRTELKLLQPGSFYALGRAIANERVLVRVGAVETSHPEAGSRKHAGGPPPAPEKVKALLPQLADLPKEAEEKSETIAELKARIRELETQRPSTEGMTPDAEVHRLLDQAHRALTNAHQERDTLRNDFINLMKIVGGGLVKVRDEASFALDAMNKHLEELEKWNPDRTGSAIGPAQPTNGRDLSIDSGELSRESAARGTTALDGGFHPVGRTIPAARSNKLKAGAERMLAALCQWYPERMTVTQMRSHAGMKKSGTFNAYMSLLRGGGYIETDGASIVATRAGLDYFGANIPKAPRTTDEVLQVWEPKLKSGARRILQVLVQRGGRPVSLPTIYKEAGLSKSGTFNAYLSSLRSARLIETGRGYAQAKKETLFL